MEKSNNSLLSVFKRQKLYIKLIVFTVFTSTIIVATVITAVVSFYGKYLIIDELHTQTFKGKITKPNNISPGINYDYPFEKEEFYVQIPDDYKKNNPPYGLLVHINSMSLIGFMPEGWEPVLKKKKMLFISPFNADNDSATQQRQSLAVLSALLMKRDYNVDPARVYISGLSGGARIACNMAFLQPDIFKGTILNCGANYFKPIEFAPERGFDSAGEPYVYDIQASKSNIDRCRIGSKFNLITSSGDWRRSELLDIYEKGFKKDGFQIKLYDVPKMGHENCPPEILEKAIDYLDAK